MKKNTQNMWENLFVIATQFATKKQLKKFNHCAFFFKFMSQNILKVVFFYVLTLKYICHFGMSLKKLNPKRKT
jgi:hypothetical protein